MTNPTINQTAWSVLIRYPEGTYPSKGDMDQLTLKLHPGIETPAQVEVHLRDHVSFPAGTEMLVFPHIG